MDAGSDTPEKVEHSSSGFTFIVMGICGAGVAGLLAAGLFVLREKQAQKTELENQRLHDSYLASDKGSTKRAATAITSVECDFGVEKHVERQNEILALQEQIMYGNPSDIAASITKGPAAMATIRQVNAPDKTPLLPAPSLYFSSNNRTRESDEEVDLNDVEKEEAKEDVDALPSLNSPISAAYRRTSRVQKTFSTTSNSSGNFQFPHVPTSTPLNSQSELRDSFGFGLPDIPSSASIRNERLSGRRRSLADVSSKTLSQASLQIKTTFSPGFAPSKRLSPVGNFQLMRSQSGGHNRTVSDALGNSGDRLSSVGTNSFFRVASTIQPPVGGTSRSVGMHSRTSSLGSVTKGELPTELEILKRPKSERERRRESMVREAMKRASVEHVLVTPGGQ